MLRARYGLDPALPVILSVGRLDADKRVDEAVRAAAAAMQVRPAQLLVVGDGKQRAEVEQLCAALGIQARSRFPGYVAADGDLPGLYRLASVFVTASRVEIQSSVVLEAFAAGLPVVTVRASSMAEFVEDGVNGCLAAPGDVDGLARALTSVLRQSPEERAATRAAALRTARLHDTASAVAAHEAFYQELVRVGP
jgi:glycosyltransferase involved in cell wall biosynthesis